MIERLKILQVLKALFRFEEVLRSIPLPAIIAEGDLSDVRVNEGAARLLGLPTGENLAASGRTPPWTVLGGNDPLPRESYPLSQALRGEELQDQEVVLAFPGGQRLPVAASARPLLDRRGRIAGAICVLRDLSESARTERERELARRQEEEAKIIRDWRLAIANHDIRSALNPVNLLAEILEQTASGREGQEEMGKLAVDMKVSTASLIKVITETMELTRSSAGRPPPRETEFSLRDLVEEEWRNHLERAREKGLQPSVQHPDPPLWIRADRLRLAHLLGFLAEQSIRSTSRGSVTLRAGTDPEGNAEVLVTDTGGGLPPEIERQLLDHLSRIRGPSQDEGDPGLAVGRKLAESMGAKLSLQNRPGEGATYRITLTAASIVPAPPAPAPGGAATGGAGNVSSGDLPCWWL